MSDPIKKVVIIGAGGTVGSAVLDALVAADNFAVTILTRPESTTNFNHHVPVLRCEYDQPSLETVFKGQDAVVCCVAIPGVQYEKTMIDAAAAVGVRRFVLNQFANSPKQNGFSDLDMMRAAKREMVTYATQKANEVDGFTWTALATGNFIDYSLKKYSHVMGFDISTNHARIMDAGKEPFTATTMAGIGQAVAGILRHPAETANRFCCVSSIKTSQLDILRAYERVTGKQWTVETLDSGKVLKRGREMLEAGERQGMLDVLAVQLFGEGGGRSIVTTEGENDSQLLGVAQPTIDEIVQEVLAA